MTAVVVFRAANLSAKRGCERGIVSHPQSASGMARSFLGDTSFEPGKQSFRRVSKAFHTFRSFAQACLQHRHLSKGASACVTADRSDPTPLRAST